MHVAILSLNRPHYLEQVLASLRPQVSARDEIVLFQDGGLNHLSGRLKATDSDIKACIELFQTAIPWGRVLKSNSNIGIALNYERAEQYFFAQLRRPYALFLEDDLVLSNDYLNVIRELLQIAQGNDRIAYVSGCGNMWASREEQSRRQTELQHMHENWGFAMTRASWLEERPFRLQYLAMVKDRDYSVRTVDAILGFYSQRGWKTVVSSQDGARWIASIELGKVRLTTFACHARYIGLEGEHFTPELYEAGGFAQTEMFEGPRSSCTPPSSEQIEAWLEIERRRFRGEIGPFYPGHNGAVTDF